MVIGPATKIQLRSASDVLRHFETFETVCYAFDVSEKVTGNRDVSYTGWV